MELSLVKQNDNSLRIAYDSDFDKIQKMKAGEIYKCQVTKDRSGPFHRKFFALIRMVFDNQELFDHQEDLRREVIIAAGFFTTYNGLDGGLVKQAMSIKYDAMDGFDFQELYERTKDIICIHFRFTNESIEDNIHQYY